MTNTPDVEDHRELQDEEYDMPPKRAKMVYHSNANTVTEELFGDEDLPSIKLICTKEYSNVNKITDRDHLMDKNCHEWKERMKRVFFNCDMTGYITGDIECPNESINPKGAHNWYKNDSWLQQIIMHNITSSQMNHIGMQKY
jgi:hypothetical protein